MTFSKDLRHPPLELVVCQVRHEDLPGGASSDAVMKLLSALPNHFDRLEQPAPTVTFDLSQPMAAPAQAGGWRLGSKDSRWNLHRDSNSFTLESTGYASWTEFREVFLAVVEAISSLQSPDIITRIGLRYYDRVIRQDTGVPIEWTGLFHPAVLGLVDHPRFGSQLRVAQGYQEFDVDGRLVQLRTSCATDGGSRSGYSMVLDTDCIDPRAIAFSAVAVDESLEALHQLNLDVFESVVMPELMEEFVGE